ncbi:CoA-transferase family III [Apiospora arundinis]
MILDPEGYVTIATACPHCDQVRRFQASSSVLRLASPVFSKMLGPNFQEGESSSDAQATPLSPSTKTTPRRPREFSVLSTTIPM